MAGMDALISHALFALCLADITLVFDRQREFIFAMRNDLLYT